MHMGMDARVGLWRKLSTEELMLLNCGVGEPGGVAKPEHYEDCNARGGEVYFCWHPEDGSPPPVSGGDDPALPH